MKHAAILFLALAACGSSDPIVGTWVDNSVTSAGNSPDVATYKATLVFSENKAVNETVIETFTGTAANYPSCASTTTVTGTWTSVASGTTKTITINTTGGTSNVRTLCKNTVDNSAGTAFSPTDATSFALSYTVTGNSQLLTAANAGLSVQFAKQ